MADAAGTAEGTQRAADGLPSGSVTLFFSDIEGSTRAWEQHPVAMPGALAQHTGRSEGPSRATGGRSSRAPGTASSRSSAARLRPSRPAIDAARPAGRGLGRDRPAAGTDRPAHRGDGARARRLPRTPGEPVRPDHGRGSRGPGARLRDDVPRDRDPPGARHVRGPGTDPAARPRRWRSGCSRCCTRTCRPSFRRCARSTCRRPTWPASPSSLIGRDDALAELAGLLGRTRLLTLTAGWGGQDPARAPAPGRPRRRLHPRGLAHRAGRPVLNPRWSLSRSPPRCASPTSQAGRTGRPSSGTCATTGRAAARTTASTCSRLGGTDRRRPPRGRAPGLAVLTTSREALDVPGELVWRVPPLPGGEPGHAARPRLFVTGPGPSMQGFDDRLATGATPSPRCAGGWTGCRWPSSWRRRGSGSLSLVELAARLDDRFRLLTGGQPHLPPSRQRTLGAVVDGSYDLLAEPETHAVRPTFGLRGRVHPRRRRTGVRGRAGHGR